MLDNNEKTWKEKTGEAFEQGAFYGIGAFFGALGSGIHEQFFGTSAQDVTYGGDPGAIQDPEEKKKSLFGDLNIETVLIVGVIGIVVLALVFRR